MATHVQRSPHGTARKVRGSGKKAAPPAASALPQDEDEDEAAQAAALLAEALGAGTPRQQQQRLEASRKKPRAAPIEDEEAADEEDEGEEDAWEIECVLARRRLKAEVEGGPPGEWQYLIRWVDKPAEEDRWVPEGVLVANGFGDWLQDDLEAAETERRMESLSTGSARANA